MNFKHLIALSLILSLGAPVMANTEKGSKKSVKSHRLSMRDYVAITGGVAAAVVAGLVINREYQKRYNPTFSDRANSWFVWGKSKADDAAVAAGLKDPSLKQQAKEVAKQAQQDIKEGASELSEQAGNAFYGWMNKVSAWYNKKTDKANKPAKQSKK